MPPIAIWYHCKISGEGIPNPVAAFNIVARQMELLKESGLEFAADEIHVGINGPTTDVNKLSSSLPDRAFVYCHGPHSRSELPTFALLRPWLRSHSTANVLYHHSKGVTNPNDPEKAFARTLMENAVIRNWNQCVNDLNRGFDAVGVNLVDPDTRPVLPGRFFVGNFWWAKARYLLTLPPIPDRVKQYTTGQRCIAEFWVGRSRTRPMMKDYERPELSNWCVASGRVRAN
jgi:hypothetical protein